MDYDVLLRIARSAIKSIRAQDTTDYWESLAPDATLVVNTNPAAGDIRATVQQLAATWDDNIQHKRRQLETALGSKTMLNEDRKREQKNIDDMVNRPKLELCDLGGLGVQLAAGAEDVGRATLSVFEWMHKYAAKTNGIAMPTSKQEVRRRKETAASKAAAAAAASSSSHFMSTTKQRQLRDEQLAAQAEAEAAARTLEGKLQFSCITVTYGLPHMLLRDELFVHEDGKVVLVVRTPLAPEDGYIPQVMALRDVAVMDPTGGTRLTQRQSNNLNNSSSARGRSESPRASGRRSEMLPISANNNVGSIAARGGGAVPSLPPISSPRGGAAAASGGGSGSARFGTDSGRGALGASQMSGSGTGTNAPVGCSRVLDFSFKQITEPYDLLRVEPALYIRHVAAPVAKSGPKNLAEEVRQEKERARQEAQGGLLAAAAHGKRVGITATNKKGETQHYGFSIGGADGGAGAGGGGGADDLDGGAGGLGGEDGEKGLGGGSNTNNNNNGPKKSAEEQELDQLVSHLRTKVVCDSVRICNNEMRGADRLLPVLRNLVVNHYLRVQWLDLSNNNLMHVPIEISQMPLRALHLHGNKIESWKSLEAELPKLTRLQHFTVFGNPLADNAATFRPRALAMLLHVPFKMLPFKALDFVPLTLVDVQSAASFLQRHPRALEVTSPRTVRAAQKRDAQHQHGGGGSAGSGSGASPKRDDTSKASMQASFY